MSSRRRTGWRGAREAKWRTDVAGLSTWRGAPRPGPSIDDARRGEAHNAEILRAGAGAPRGLRRRDHNAEAECTANDGRNISGTITGAPPRTHLRHLEIFLLICLLYNAREIQSWIALDLADSVSSRNIFH